MTTQAAYVAPMQSPYVFWLAAWHNVPFPAGEPRSCRITRATLEIDVNATVRWSIPLSSILTCERHVHHDGVAGLYLYAKLTIDAAAVTTGSPNREEIFLGALDPISQSWDWKETLNLITLINDLRERKATSLHTNPYYRALERRGRLAGFTEIAYSWDALLPPAHYDRHPLMQELRRQSARTIGLPLLLGLLCVLLVALLFWLQTGHWLVMSSALGLFPIAVAAFWPDHTYRRCQRFAQQLGRSRFLLKEVNSKTTF